MRCRWCGVQFAVANLIAVQGYKISTTAHFTNFAHALYRVKVGIAATMRFVKNWALVIGKYVEELPEGGVHSNLGNESIQFDLV